MGWNKHFTWWCIFFLPTFFVWRFPWWMGYDIFANMLSPVYPGYFPHGSQSKRGDLAMNCLLSGFLSIKMMMLKWSHSYCSWNKSLWCMKPYWKAGYSPRQLVQDVFHLLWCAVIPQSWNFNSSPLKGWKGDIQCWSRLSPWHCKQTSHHRKLVFGTTFSLYYIYNISYFYIEE